MGVKAQINPVCKCSSVSHLNRWQSCLPNPCSNNGTCEPLVSGGYKCNCPADNPDQFGPNCQILAATYNGQGMFYFPFVDGYHISLIPLNSFFPFFPKYGQNQDVNFETFQ